MVGMSFSSENGASSASAFVDSAVSGSQDEASLFWTSVSFAAKPDATATISSQATRTSHFVRGPVSFPATARCMLPPQHFLHSKVIGVFPDALLTPPADRL